MQLLLKVTFMSKKVKAACRCRGVFSGCVSYIARPPSTSMVRPLK
jgi:hypothetical protein